MFRILTRVVAVASFLCVILMALGTTNAQTPPKIPDFSVLKHKDVATIVNVIDPYRLSTEDGRVIRLSGVNVPDYHPERAGEVSLMVMRVLEDMLRGKQVTMYQPKDKLKRTNRMGHHTAHLIVGDLWVQGALLELGLARVETDSDTPELAGNMLALEAAARREKRGLWAYDSFQVLTPETAMRYKDSFQIIEGTVNAAAMKNNRVYLNFGENWKDDFTVSVPPQARRKFSKVSIDLLTLGKAKVRVRGWVQDYNGPYIEISHPEALEILSTAPVPKAAP